MGENRTCRVAVWLGFSVSGKVAPDIEKPLDAVAELTVTAAVPVDESVTDCVVLEPTETLPKLRLVELSPRLAVPAFSFRTKESVTEPALAVRVTDCAEAEEETVAVNDALAELAGTVMDAGTETTLSLLAKLTTMPPLGAAAFSETVQASVPAPVMEELVHEFAFRTGTPVPARATVDELPVEELLLMVS